jgi:hypothetical protein
MGSQSTTIPLSAQLETWDTLSPKIMFSFKNFFYIGFMLPILLTITSCFNVLYLFFPYSKTITPGHIIFYLELILQSLH